jgi:photosystem II stability/assembly factor-like uncharacterized protein
MSTRPLQRTLLLLLVACAPAPAPEPAPVDVQRAEQASGTRALLIAVSPVNERVVWASGAQGTWVRTTDGGTTWRSGRVPGADSLQFRDVHGVDSSTALLLSIGNGSQSRVYRTTDGGARWERLHTNPDAAGFYDCFSFWDAARGVLIGDAVDGRMVVLTTADGGTSWQRVGAAALPPAQQGEGSFAASGTCVTTHPGGRAWIVMNAGTRSRLLRTRDFGRTWALDTLPITARDGSGAQSVTFRDAQHGLVLGGGYASQRGDALVATTRDGGDTWTPRAGPAFKVGSWGGVFVPGARTPTVVAAGPNGAAWSRDDGVSWAPIDTSNYWSIGFASPRAGWAVGTQGRITKLSGF